MFTSTLDAQAFIDALTAGRDFQGSTIEFVNAADTHHAKMDVVLQFLQSRDRADLLAQPRMRVSVGEVARIVTGEEIPTHQRLKVVSSRTEINIEYKTVGVQLDVMPMLVGQDFIEVALTPSVSEVAGYAPAGISGVVNPVIITRQAATKVIVSDRELFTIGGLDQTRETVTETKVPILGDIPLIKYLFRSSRKTTKKVQVWFGVRPTIGAERGRIIFPELTGVSLDRKALPK